MNVFKNICYDYFPVSQMFYSFFLYGIIAWISKNIPVRNGGKGCVRWVRVRTKWRRVVAIVHLRMMGEGGHISGVYILIACSLNTQEQR